jgi:CzcA family heavy metal efflux pump
MLNAVIRFALRHRPLVVIASMSALVYGAYAATTLPIDVFPALDRPRVTVMTECPGLATEEVETLVTYPQEAALLGAAGVEDVRSQSGFGLAAVMAEFGWGTDIATARQTVQERLATVAADMPNGVRPQMAPTGAIMGQIMAAGLRRQSGPKGGELAAITGTPYYAERLLTGSDPPALFAWKPTDRRNPSAWDSVPVADVRWAEPGSEGERIVKATIAGQARNLTFPSELQRQLALRELADWVVRPRLLKVGGVAQAIPMGGGKKQYQVLVDPTALHEYGVTLQQVEESLRENNVNFTGGYSTAGGFERPIRVIGRLGPRPEQVVQDLRKVPVKTTPHRTIPLEQVARVTEGPQIKRGDASVNGQPGVVVTVIKQPHADTRRLTENVVAALREVESSLPADVVVETDLYQLRGFIDRGVNNVADALIVGALLVLVVLFLFLLNVRTTFISLAAIPLSLAVTVIVFKVIGAMTGFDLSINVMTLGGIAVAMGELVDDAIVDVENIYRRLRENAALPNPRSALRVVYEASAEIRSAIVFGTAVVVLVFLPLFALSGIEGRLFVPLAIAYIVSILASLLVSLTVTPVMSFHLLAGSMAVHRTRDSFLLRGLKWFAGGLIRFSLHWTGLLLVLTWLIVAACAWRLTTLGADFLPAFDEGVAQVNVTLPAGSSLDASNEVAARTDARLATFRKSAANPNGEVLSFLRRTGRGEMDEHADPPNENEYVVVINPECGKPRDQVLATLQHALEEEVPGTEIEVEQPLAHLMSHLLSGVNAQIAIKVYGDDLDTLERIAREIRAAASGVDGVASLAIEPIRKVDEVHIRLRPDDLTFHGVDRAYVGKFVQTALNGEVVSQVVEGQRRFDLVVRLAEPYRADIANLGRLRLTLPDGRDVLLKDLADVTPPAGGDAGANQVKRDNARRRLVVRCNARGRDLASVVTDIRQNVEKKVALPEGYFIEYGGQFESQRRATRLIAILAGVSVVGMFVVLLMLFPSPWALPTLVTALLVGLVTGAIAGGFGSPIAVATLSGCGAFFLTTLFFPSAWVVLQILNAIPTAFIGGVLALVLTGQTLTVASLVGFISLGGIAVRNGILLVTHYVHLMRSEGETFSEHMILRGSLERLAPVLMTALTAGIGLVPLVVAGQQPGREILYPVATVILGGLVTSTFCEFLIHPGLYWRFSGRATGSVVVEESDDELAD